MYDRIIAKLMILTLATILTIAVISSMAHAGTVTFEWGTVAGADNYHLYQMEVGGTPVTNPPRIPVLTVPHADVDRLVGTVSGITPGAYSFFVTAANGWGESPPSNTVSTPPVLVLPPPNLLIVRIQ